MNADSRISVACDSVIFDFQDHIPQVLLVLRKCSPFKNYWALPGGFVKTDEGLDRTAIRELYEETGVDLYPTQLQQILIKDQIDRDPRGRVISIVFSTSVKKEEHPLCAGDDAADAAWFKLDELPLLAADHLEIIREVLGEIYYDRS